MKSQKSMPNGVGHVGTPKHKTNHPAAAASMGTNEAPTHKSHEGDISLGEGLEYGAVHSAHNKHKVKDAKHVKGLQMAAQAEHERRENGGADPTGGCE